MNGFLDACEACDGHGPIKVRMNGSIPRDHPNAHMDFENYETTLCAYCKSDLEEIETLEVEKI